MEITFANDTAIIWTIDLLARGAVFGGALFICVGLAIGSIPRRKVIALTSFFTLVLCYLAVSSPTMDPLVGNFRAVLTFGATLAPFALTWAVLEILYDDVHDKWGWFVAAAFIAFIGLFAGWFPVLQVVRGILVLLLYLALLCLAVLTGPDDLVEKRRIFRRWFVGCMALLAITISTVELLFNASNLPLFIYPLQATSFFVLNTLFGHWVFSVSPDIWPMQTKAKRIGAENRDPIIQKLNTLMDQGAWRQEGLSVGGLAEQLKIPEHRLRVVINRDLGFRNFSTFINGHRIAAAQKALGDPEQYDHSILTIAFDCGFGSLGPFNKAFRQQTGQSPTEYRKTPR